MKKKYMSLNFVLLLAGIYFISQFLRSALGMTALNISEDFNLDYEQIGRLGGVFFLSFALMQIPLGIILDKYNPIKVIVVMLFIIYLGTLILSFAKSFELLFFARILQGIGCSVCLMGPLVYLAKNSEKKKFSKYSGIIMGVGGLGALFAFSPFHELTLLYGWQKSFFVFSFLVLAAILIFIAFKFDNKQNKKKNKNRDIGIFIYIFTNKNFLRILPMSIFGYASFAFLLTLWGNKFLSIKLNINDKQIALILMSMALFWTFGSIFFGLVNNKIIKNKTLVIFSASALIFILLLLSFIKIDNFYFIFSIFSIYGFLGAFTLVILDHYRCLFDKDILGKVLTSANLFNFGGVFFVQWITGLVIEFSSNKERLSVETGFVISFALISFFLLLSVYFYSKSDEGK